MPQALITVNTVVGSNVVLPINTLVALDNVNVGGETTYTWSILDQPPGAVDALSSVSVQNPSLTPKKEGTYLIRLIVNQGGVTEQENRVVCGIRQLKTLERIPAAGETTEGDLSDGWATPSNSLLRRIDTLLSDPGILVGVNVSGAVLSRGQVVRAPDTAVIKSTLPGQETVPGFSRARALALDEIDELLCVVEGQPDGTTTIPSGGSTDSRLTKVRYIGRISGIAIANGPVAAGDIIYVNDTSGLDAVQGTLRRRVGTAMQSAAFPLPGNTADVWFDGVGGSDVDLTPITEKYVTWGNTVLPNAHRIDGTNATPMLASSNRFRAGDILAGTVALEAQGFVGSAEDIFRALDSAGAALVRVDSTGRLIVVSSGLTVTAGGFSLGAGNITFAAANQRLVWPGGVGSTYIGSPSVQAIDVVLNAATDIVQFFNGGTGVFTQVLIATAGGHSLALRALAASTLISSTGAGHLDFSVNSANRWRIAASGELQAQGANRAIQNVLDPVTAQDAATKIYVDAVSRQNIVINGRMDFWQRTLTDTLAGFAATGGATFTTDRVYSADRWYAFTQASQFDGGPSLSTTQFASGIAADGFPLGNRLRRTNAAAGAHGLVQEIDREMVELMRGKILTVVFKARIGTTYNATLQVRIVAGNAVSTSQPYRNEIPTTEFGYTGTITSLLAPTTISPYPSGGGAYVECKHTATVAVPTDATNMVLEFSAPTTGLAASGSVNDFFEITGVRLYPAASAVAVLPYTFAGGSLAGELELCQRYCEKSYEVNTPKQTSTDNGAHLTNASAVLVANTQPFVLGMHPRFLVKKRVVPHTAGNQLAVKLYSRTAVADQWTVGGAAAVAVSAPQMSECGFFLSNNTGADSTPGTGTTMGHWIAESDI